MELTVVLDKESRDLLEAVLTETKKLNENISRLQISVQEDQELRNLNKGIIKITYDDKMYEVRKEVWDASIDTLEIGFRAYHLLKDNGIKTISQLILKTENQILSIPKLGRKSLKEIRCALWDQYCLRLGSRLITIH